MITNEQALEIIHMLPFLVIGIGLAMTGLGVLSVGWLHARLRDALVYLESNLVNRNEGGPIGYLHTREAYLSLDQKIQESLDALVRLEDRARGVATSLQHIVSLVVQAAELQQSARDSGPIFNAGWLVDLQAATRSMMDAGENWEERVDALLERVGLAVDRLDERSPSQREAMAEAIAVLQVGIGHATKKRAETAPVSDPPVRPERVYDGRRTYHDSELPSIHEGDGLGRPEADR